MFGYNPPGPSAPVVLIATPIEPDGNLSVPYFIIECTCAVAVETKKHNLKF